MWDDQNDKRIKDAADHYHPAYDDNAWKKMEQLLDEHLPQKKGRRWMIAFIPLLLLLVGGIVYLAISYNSSKTSSYNSSKTSQKIDAKSTLGKKQPASASADKEESNLSNDITATEKAAAKNNGVPQTANNNFLNENVQNKPGKNLHSQKGLLKNNIGSGLAEENAVSNTVKDLPASEPILSAKSENEQSKNVAISENDKDQPKKVSADADITAKDNRNVNTGNTVIKNDSKKSSTAKKTTTNANRFNRNFGITVSAGPDVSGVRLKDAGKVTISYGAGVSYAISKRFTLRTGFYVSKKIYYAGSQDYHLPSGVGSNYLDNVDANCKVYEIPITASYSFGKTKNHSWFAAAGFSSYLMKKEAYQYNYKTAAGQTWSRDWSVKNQNQHFFSILDLSAGYEYTFNKRFSIMAEPYISLPLSGIGLGKIKLNSGGILFTLTVKPFK